jgi:alpha-maltose-1-phosphate synthase
VKILAAIIAPPHLTASGGARAGRRLSEALSGDCDMTIASMSTVDAAGPGAARQANVRVFLPPPLCALPRKYRSLFYFSDIPALVAAGQWDLVHLHNPMPALEMARIAAACTKAGIPYVISTHGFNEVANGEAVYGFDRLRRLVWRGCVSRPVTRTVQGAAAVFALSPADIDIVRGFGFEGQIMIVPNGVDIPRASDSAGDREIWDRLGVLPPEECPGITCMFLGNHTPNKGVPVLLEAFAQLECPYQLVVGGERRAEIDYQRYEKKTRPGQRIVVTGRLTDPEVSALLRRSELFVFPTLADTFPLVVLEAMAHGCPVLASQVGGIPYQLDRTCGALVTPGDPAALRDAVARLAEDRPLLRMMGAQAAVRVQADYTWRAAADRALCGYTQILHRERETVSYQWGSPRPTMAGSP